MDEDVTESVYTLADLSEGQISMIRPFAREGLAALLLLRLAELHDAQHDTIKLFDGLADQPLIPEALHLCNWLEHEDPGHIADQLKKLAQHLTQLQVNVAHPMATFPRVLADALHSMLYVQSAAMFDLLRWVGKTPMETTTERRALLEVFDRLIGAEHGDLSASAHISSLVVALGNPRPGELVYDPCFGNGTFLVVGSQYVERSQIEQRRPAPRLKVAGIELNSSAFLVGLTRILLAGIEDPWLELGNSLEHEVPIGPARDGCDLVLCNPPIGAKASGRIQRHQHYAISTRDSVGLFVQHALSQLKSGGRAVVVVPEGFLFRGGSLRDLRRWLVESGHVEAVISLPSGALKPYARVKTCLLVLRKNGGATRVRMADAYALSVMLQERSGDKTPTISPEIAQQLAVELRRPELRKPMKGHEDDTPDRGAIGRVIWEVDVSALEAIDWDLTPRRRTKGELERVLDGFRATLGDIMPSVCLSEVAEISLGRSIIARDLLEEPPPDNPVGYVRIGDLSQGTIVRVSSWLCPETAGIEKDWALRANDVLLTKSGTIGKSALVRPGAADFVAGRGLYVLRVDQQRLHPGFLLAYLASRACKQWLAAQSRGAVIQHLNRAVLERLPVLLPPLPHQARAAARFREFGTDVFAYLTDALDTGEEDRLIARLAELDAKVPSFGNEPTELPALSQFESIVEFVCVLSDWSAHGRVHADAARSLKQLSDALAPLAGVSQVPSGAALLNVLQEAKRGVLATVDQIPDSLPESFSIRGIAERLILWLRASIDDLNENTGLKVQSSPTSLEAGSFAEFSVELQNSGVLPLRGLRVETKPDWGVAQIPYLAEQGTCEVKLCGHVPNAGQDLSMRLLWQAKTLLGRLIRGEIELAIRVIDPVQASGSVVPEFGASPYVTGDPLGPAYGHDLFYGREDLIAQIGRQIGTHGNVVLLEGNRRTGKTSILNHLAGPTAIPGWLAVYASLQGTAGSDFRTGVPTAEVFRVMARGIATGLRKLTLDVPLPNGQVIPAGKPSLGVARACHEGIGAESPFADFLDYLELVLAALEPLGLGLLLMLDEFDKLQVGIDNGVTSPQVPENIRFLIQSNPRFSAILTGSRRLKRLREEYWSALYGLGTSIQVTALDEASARKVVTEPVRDLLTYSRAAVDTVLEATARHPYLMQCLCSRIFEDAFRTGTRSITDSVVSSAVMSLVRDNEHFATLWDYAGQGPDTGRRRRQLILLLCGRSLKQGTHVDFGLLPELLAQEGVDVEDASLDVDLGYLRELELVDFRTEAGDGHYSLSIPMMAEWIDQTQDAKVVASRARTEAEEENV